MSQTPVLLKSKKLPNPTFVELIKGGGMKRGELCILLAKPSTGKSAFAENYIREHMKDPK